MHLRLLVALLALACGACASSSSGSGTAGGASTSGAKDAVACNAPYGFPEAGAGVVACTVGRAYVRCKSPSGGECTCISDDPSQCSGCSASNGYSCSNTCMPGWFGVACGGPPNVLDGAPTNYQSVPSGCTNVGYTPAGSEFACCPCASP